MGFDLVPLSPLNSVPVPANANNGRSSLSANHDILLLGLGLRPGCVFREAVRRHQAAACRLQPALQRGDEVFLMLRPDMMLHPLTSSVRAALVCPVVCQLRSEIPCQDSRIAAGESVS